VAVTAAVVSAVASHYAATQQGNGFSRAPEPPPVPADARSVNASSAVSLARAVARARAGSEVKQKTVPMP
jgi:hypothetical protein